MEFGTDLLVSPAVEVPGLDGDVVTAIRILAGRRVGKRTIAREVDVSINTVRRHLRRPVEAGRRMRPSRRLSDDSRAKAQQLYAGAAEGNAADCGRCANRGCRVCSAASPEAWDRTRPTGHSYKQEDQIMSQQFSTATLVKVAEIEADWDQQIGILKELQNRPDLFNVQPILALSVQETHHSKVGRAAVECEDGPTQ